MIQKQKKQCWYELWLIAAGFWMYVWHFELVQVHML